MKLKNMLRICCLALAVLLCGGVLAACKDDESVSAADSSAGTAESSESLATDYTDESGNYVAKTSGNRYDGRTVTFLTCDVNATYNSELMYNDYDNPTPTTSSEEIPEVINAAYKTRNDLVEEQLGITIAEEYVLDTSRTNSAMATRIRQDNLVFTSTYQIVVPCLYDGATLAAEDMLLNLYELPGIQMDAPWWDQIFNKEVTIGGQLYFTIGDIGTINKSATAALTYNKALYTEYQLEAKYGGTPYDFVRNGTWTLDLALQMTKEFGDDLDQNGVINYKDLVGWSGQLDDMWSLFYGSGSTIASTDTSDGFPVLTMYSERSAMIMEKIQTLVQDDAHYISANDYFGDAQWPSVLLRDNFIAGNSLFYNGSMSTPMELGNMEDDYGLLPIPKGDESQETYYSLVNPWVSTCFAVPISVPMDDRQMVADCLNAMGAASGNIVADAYLEQCLEYMKTRDNDTIDMIENYILPGRGCDIGMIFAWGGWMAFCIPWLLSRSAPSVPTIRHWKAPHRRHWILPTISSATKVDISPPGTSVSGGLFAGNVFRRKNSASLFSENTLQKARGCGTMEKTSQDGKERGMFSRLNEAELHLLDGLQALLQNRVFDFLMPIVTFFGNAGWLWIAIGVLLLCFQKHRRVGLTLLVGLLCSLLIGNLLLKLSVARPRPCWLNEAFPLLIERPSDYSFPSGHTMASFIGATVLAKYRRRWGIAAFAIATLIAFSRLYLYVHFPTDVLAGAVLGVGIGLLVTRMMQKLFLRYGKGDSYGTDLREEL